MKKIFEKSEEGLLDEELVEQFDVDKVYLDLVKEACHNDHSYNIPNSSLSHAKLLIYFLIRKAKKEIKILSSNFHEECYNHEKIKESLEKANDNSKIETKYVYRNKEGVPDYIKKNAVHINHLIKDVMEKDFIVVDGKSYRIEEPHGREVKKVKGVVNFNDRDYARDLNELFEKIFKASQKNTGSGK